MVTCKSRRRRNAATAVIVLSGFLASCAAYRPYRVAALSSGQSDPRCGTLYAASDGKIAALANDYSLDFKERSRRLKAIEHEMRVSTSMEEAACWQSAYEKHLDYDLLYAEFDDSGEPTDIQGGKNVTYATSELHLIKTRLKDELAKAKASGSGLNVVVFTHGWHGSASAFDDYSLEFKGILQEVTRQEADSHLQLATQKIPNGSHPRRTIGIEVAWRGDSLLTPPIPLVSGSRNAFNVWDRKITAKVVAAGSVQELFAFLNEFYRENTCDPYGSAEATSARGQCAAVHLLTIAHSFGALINLHAMLSRIDSGLNVPAGKRAFGLGDMSILLNPAVEGTSYRGLFESAVNRQIDEIPENRVPQEYQRGAVEAPLCATTSSITSNYPSKAQTSALAEVHSTTQIPTLVILQSEGDDATKSLFPPMQTIATLFRRTLSSQERYDKNHAVGWIGDFRTHLLAPGTKADSDDRCDTLQGAPQSFCPFAFPSTNQTHFLTLTGVANGKMVPDFMPLWSVSVSDKIMEEHNDIWNPQIVRLMAELFRDAYEQEEYRNTAAVCEAK
jgi:hypothetical protein